MEKTMNFEEKAKYYLKLRAEDKKAEAQKFYDENILDEASEKFTEKFERMKKEGKFKNYKYLILTVGFSPEPLIFWIRAIRPEKVLFMYNKNTEKYYDHIMDNVNLRPRQCTSELIENSGSKDIYKKIKEYIEKNGLMNELHKIAIDISGGKKSMVSMCSFAASYLNIDAVYVDNTGYNPEYRMPTPGTEVPFVIEDPLEVFGERELSQAITKFNSGDYIGASQIFENIKKRVEKPRKYEVYQKISQGYKYYECMKFCDAIEIFIEALEIADRYNITDSMILSLKNQIGFIEPLGNIGKEQFDDKKILGDKKIFWHLFAYNMAMAKHNMNIEKMDIASLISYRCLEMLSQYILYQNGIYHGEARYKNIDEQDLLKKVNEISVAINPKTSVYAKLPEKISLMQGLVISKILGYMDIEEKKLIEIFKMTQTRNKSRFAHGFEPVENEAGKNFYYNIESFAGNIWNKERETIGTKMRIEKLIDKFSLNIM